MSGPKRVCCRDRHWASRALVSGGPQILLLGIPLLYPSAPHPRGPSHSQGELGLSHYTSGAGSALGPLKSSLSGEHHYYQLPVEQARTREVADLPKDTQLVEHSGERRPSLPLPGFLSSQTNW